eukprot:2907121-Pleurochrysis_carterae.AAC.1
MGSALGPLPGHRPRERNGGRSGAQRIWLKMRRLEASSVRSVALSTTPGQLSWMYIQPRFTGRKKEAGSGVLGKEWWLAQRAETFRI